HVELFHDPVLDIEKRLSAGNDGGAATCVVAAPTFVGREYFERLARPISIIDLVQCVVLLHFDVHGLRKCFGSLQSALKWTAIDRLEVYAVESLREPL